MRLLTYRLFRPVAVALLAGATGAAADSPPRGPLAERGTWALGFDLRSEGSGFSVWKVQSPDTALGVKGSLSWALDDRDLEDPWSDRQSHRLRLELRPTLKRYRAQRNRVAPYLYYQGLAGFSGHRSEHGDREASSSMVNLGVGLGLGVDWFPFQRVSIGGRTGMNLSYRFGELTGSVTRSPGEVERVPSTDRTLSLRTLRTDLTALVYF